MAIKTDIQSTINTNLSDASNIQAVEHRAVEDALLNEMYKVATVKDTNLTTNVITLNDANFEYNLTFKKQGGLVYVYGYVSNVTSNLLNGGNFAEITNSEYFSPGSTLNVGSNSNLQFAIINNFLILVGSIAPFETNNVNGVFIVNQ